MKSDLEPKIYISHPQPQDQAWSQPGGAGFNQGSGFNQGTSQGFSGGSNPGFSQGSRPNYNQGSSGSNNNNNGYPASASSSLDAVLSSSEAFSCLDVSSQKISSQFYSKAKNCKDDICVLHHDATTAADFPFCRCWLWKLWLSSLHWLWQWRMWWRWIRYSANLFNININPRNHQ